MTTRALVLRAGDAVAVLTSDVEAGDAVHAGDAVVTATTSIPRGHKVSLRSQAVGDEVVKYGQVIGVATRAIGIGEHVHSHNLGMAEVGREYEFATAERVELPDADAERTFLGYRRADGRAATRNYIGIVTSVNCSATAARLIADEFRGSALAAFLHVDGVVALTHQSGCGLVVESEGARILLRTLRGYAAHPNFAGILVLGLGCEMVPISTVVEGLETGAGIVGRLDIQSSGGMRATVAAGIEQIRAMLPVVDALQREPIPVGELVLGLNCGGSDGYSGITANPALGYASDMLVAAGGTSVLAETPEVFGAEHLLTRRATSRAVGERLLDRIAWWRDYMTAGGGSLDDNPSPGNKAGGLTTILEKSLGAVAKAGQVPLQAVYEYAEPVTKKGLVFMDTPGYDPVSVTGIVAGGATVVCFTTGRGSVFGCRPTPSIKLGTNSELFARMGDDIDIDCGPIIDGSATIEGVGAQIFERIIRVASGEKTSSEEFGAGQEEFIPWQLGAVT